MTEFMFIYRGANRPTSPEQAQQVMQRWMEWYKDLTANGNMADTGQPLEGGGKVVQAGTKTVVDGPFAEAKDLVGGFTIVKANSIDEAAELAKGCPVLDMGGSVEVRPVMKLNF